MRSLSALLLVCLTACGGTSAADAGPQFAAIQRDFAGYTGWAKFDLGTDQGDTVHSAGTRTVYINKLPPHGSTSFPLGSILVKTIGEATATPGKTFAMAKRNGGFNAHGCVGWEWFELDGTTAPLIVWRGTQPPPGEAYNPGGVGDQCNDCHRNAPKDAVYGDAVQLDTF